MKRIVLSILAVLMIFFCLASASADCMEGKVILSVMTAAVVLYALFFKKAERFLKKHPAVRITVRMAVLILVIFALVIAALSFTSPADGSEKMLIVLGVKLKNGHEMSLLLQSRLENTLALLQEDPGLIAILTGGMSGPETVAEASMMAEWLIKQGVSPERLILEQASLTTQDSFKNILALLEAKGLSKDDPLTVVTSRFHCSRTLCYARQAGYSNVRLAPAATPITEAPVWYLREICVTVKFWLTGT